MQLEIRALDEKEDWQKISPQKLSQFAGIACCFLDAEGMRFHLPAFLIADILRNPTCGGSWSVIEKEQSRSQFALLDGEQRAAVRKSLEYFLLIAKDQETKDEIIYSLNVHWNEA